MIFLATFPKNYIKHDCSQIITQTNFYLMIANDRKFFKLSIHIKIFINFQLDTVEISIFLEERNTNLR